MSSFQNLIFILSALCFSLDYAEAQSNKISSSRPNFQITHLNLDPIIDGDIINDTVWQEIPPISQMIQIKPKFNVPSSEKTEIRVAASKNTFYVAVVCYDSAPENIVVSDSRRDSDLNDEDSFLFILDTYNDLQNGFLFGTNSNGMEYDAQIDNEGQGNFSANRQQGGVIGGTNINWDATWSVKTGTGDYGWSAEFAIPLRSLRFNSGDKQTWGINFQRNISKNTETSYWASLPLGFDIKRLSLAGKIHGLKLQNPGNLKLIPYALTQTISDDAVDPNKTATNLEFGADIKYSLTPSLTLDLTYNTDFAQVEVDEQQVNLDRFNLFFSRKTSFFFRKRRTIFCRKPWRS
ncbi:carbohydrate binding family 9 domain-containing protein [Flavobacteriaceae bacterium]|nr:carbohydrate binding family 9 domain-containing protein [Flavobacteriaceae bacterium]